MTLALAKPDPTFLDQGEEDKLAEAAELVEAEIEVLEAVLGEELVAVNTKETETAAGNLKNVRHFHVLVRSSGLSKVCEQAIELEFELPPLYPFSLPSVQVETHGHLRQAQADQLYQELLDAAAKNLGEPMLLDLVDLARDFIVDLIQANAVQASKSSAPFIREKALEILALLRDGNAPGEIKAVVGDEADKMRDEADDANFHIYGKFSGKDYEDYKAIELSQRALVESNLPLVSDFISINELFRLLPATLAVLKIEAIMRPDIAKRFATFREKLAAGAAEAAASPPCIMFHGTYCSSAGSIVRTGLIPAGKRGVKIRNGAAFGNGIYLGATPEVSLAYCDSTRQGTRLFVCAVIKGSRRDHLVYDAPDFCVVGQADQVLPLYVIHCATSRYVARESYLAMTAAGSFVAVKVNDMQDHDGVINNRLDNDDDTLARVAQEAHREAAIQNASLYFDTKRFKVLDVAPIDDDDDHTQYIGKSDLAPLVVMENFGVEACTISGHAQTQTYQTDRIIEVKETAFIDDML
ncbi:Poly ADP-ribose polymerase 6 [Hondaea fermentalgiana]|uniref:Poly ADP-ribose polymerase 6 n=1 Tax=Hondaea fermentalgiana TaxID=2315210 RepID=A0A2R5GRI3_9STRA|nr:Poly ADP-ribose polymerase 6 [Hondaea fermentalgiana]|eukprot:GBG30494.1 Poly ADP-ribose polymerase 6 [Hondaea fermentalgiana]